MANVNNAGVLPEFDLSIIVLLVILLLLGIFPDDIREYIEKDEEGNEIAHEKKFFKYRFLC